MNENTIRLILLLVGATIILGILWDGLRRKKRRLINLAEQNEIRQGLHDDDEESEEEIDDEIDESYELENEEDQESSEEDDFDEIDEEDEEDEHDDDEEFDDDIIDPDDEDYNDHDELESEEKVEKSSSKKPDFISIRLMAKQGQTFGGYDLLQFLLANRLDYGELKLFHRYADNERKEKLFSLASVNEPGDFELSKMNDFECDGLILYMHPDEHQDPLSVFDTMLDTAYDLAQDLRGILMSGRDQPWTSDTTEDIRKALE